MRLAEKLDWKGLTFMYLDIKRELVLTCGMHAAKQNVLEVSWLEDPQLMSLT
jgi:hypothetical protein